MELYLDRIEAPIRWDRLVEQIRPHYPKLAKGACPTC